MAKLLGVTPSSVFSWKSSGAVSVEMLLKVAELSNASINWLLTGEGSPFVPAETDASAAFEPDGRLNNVPISVEDFQTLHRRLLEIEAVLAKGAPPWLAAIFDSADARANPDATTEATKREVMKEPDARVELGPIIEEFDCDPELVFVAKDLCDLFESGIGDIETVIRIVHRLRGTDTASAENENED